MEIGIIGFGRFGKLMTKYLSDNNKVFVTTRKDKDKEIRKLGATPVNFKEACSKEIVIPSVPISRFKEIILKARKYLNKGALVVDVCSVKEYPVRVMSQLLPKDIQIIATHPMFGPDSAATTLKGKKIVICKIRVKNKLFRTIKDSLISRGLIIIESTPEVHDREIAKSLLLTHLIGRSMLDFGANSLEIDTEGYKRLIRILETVKNDSEQLFKDMDKYNRYSKKVREGFMKSLKKVNKRLS